MLGNKKAVSAIIATVLLILLATVLVFIITGFVVPFVKNQLGESDCLETVGKLEISDTKYTCYKNVSKIMNVQIHRGDVDLDAIKIVVGGASSKTYTIKNNNVEANVEMYNVNGSGNTTLVLPEKNGEVTYTIKQVDSVEFVSVIPVIKGDKVCEESDSLAFINQCD